MENNILDFVEYKRKREELDSTYTQMINFEVEDIISSLESYVSAYEKVMGIK